VAKTPRKQIALAQNFLRSPSLVRRLLDASSIGPADVVYEIGAGRGILTAELGGIARKVIALEKDAALAGLLRERFSGVPNVEIVEADFLRYAVSERGYKIFANIPFNRTADIVRKILEASPASEDSYLIVQKEAAEKFAGIPAETRFSILAKPWFQIQILRPLRRTDFNPVPNVDPVMIRIKKRSPPLISPQDAELFRGLVCYCFAGWKKSLGRTLSLVFTYCQWKRLSRALRFRMEATPTELTFDQWLGLLDCLKLRVPRYKQTRLRLPSTN
jgi:23S rRNA (adenine-N6)-dimethyltransferase